MQFNRAQLYRRFRTNFGERTILKVRDCAKYLRKYLRKYFIQQLLQKILLILKKYVLTYFLQTSTSSLQGQPHFWPTTLEASSHLSRLCNPTLTNTNSNHHPTTIITVLITKQTMATSEYLSRRPRSSVHSNSAEPTNRLSNLGARHAIRMASTEQVPKHPDDIDTDEEHADAFLLPEVQLVENEPKLKYVKCMTERRKLRNKEFTDW